jgi:serine/threonine protein kinase
LCGRRDLWVIGPSQHRPDTFTVIDLANRHDMDLWIAGRSAPGEATFGRFNDVANVMARLRHPHILSIWGAGVHEQRAYLLLEHVAGQSLKGRITAQPLTVAEAVELSIGLANAVEFLHRQGFDDLDLATIGVFFSEDGTLKIDLRRTLDRRVFGGIESDGSFIMGGITGCEAPELIEGQVDRNGREADIYALGAILFEMLTGRAALIRGAVGLGAIRRILELDPVRPRSLNKSVDRALESICLRCLAKNPRERYASAASRAREVERWRAGAERTHLIGQLWRRFLAAARR